MNGNKICLILIQGWTPLIQNTSIQPTRSDPSLFHVVHSLYRFCSFIQLFAFLSSGTSIFHTFWDTSYSLDAKACQPNRKRRLYGTQKDWNIARPRIEPISIYSLLSPPRRWTTRRRIGRSTYRLWKAWQRWINKWILYMCLCLRFCILRVINVHLWRELAELSLSNVVLPRGYNNLERITFSSSP